MAEADERNGNCRLEVGDGEMGERVGGGRGVVLDRLAHEIRAPLAAIQSMAEALAGGHLGRMEDQRHAAYVASIADTARHALAVVEAMLAPVGERRVEAGDASTSIGLEALAREVVLGMSVLASRSGTRLELGPAGNHCAAVARPTDLRQILINLISNGMAHAGNGATVTVTTGCDGDVAWVEVADNGAGIAPALLDRIRARAALDGDRGSGPPMRIRLGISLTRALAEANGGQLDIESTSTGTRARIVLPAG